MKVVHPGSPVRLDCHIHNDDRGFSRMNLRKNARLTPQGRLLMVCRIEEQGWKVADALGAPKLPLYPVRPDAS